MRVGAKDRVRFACVIGRINRGGEKVNSTRRGNLSPAPLRLSRLVSVILRRIIRGGRRHCHWTRPHYVYGGGRVLKNVFNFFFPLRFVFVLLPAFLNPSPSYPLRPLSLAHHRREPPPLSRCGRFIRPVRVCVSKLYVCHLPVRPPTAIAA